MEQIRGTTVSLVTVLIVCFYELVCATYNLQAQNCNEVFNSLEQEDGTLASLVNGLTYKHPERYKQVDKKIEISLFEERIKDVKLLWEGIDLNHKNSTNPLRKLFFQSEAKDLSSSSKSISKQEINHRGLFSLENEYLFFVYLKQFYRHLILGTVYMQPDPESNNMEFIRRELNSEEFNYIYDSGTVRESTRSMIFNDNYTVEQYAQDTWNWVMSNSIYRDRLEDNRTYLSCLSNQTLSFIAWYTLMEYFKIVNFSDTKMSEFKSNFVEKLNSYYNDLEYLNRLYIIFFVGVETTLVRFFPQEVQKIRDNISMYYQTKPSKNSNVWEMKKNLFEEALYIFNIDTYSKSKNYSTPHIFRISRSNMDKME